MASKPHGHHNREANSERFAVESYLFFKYNPPPHRLPPLAHVPLASLTAFRDNKESGKGFPLLIPNEQASRH